MMSARLTPFFRLVDSATAVASVKSVAKQNCAARPTDCPPGPMSALGGSGRAAPRRKSGFDPERTPKSSDSVCEITIRAGQTDPGLFRD